MALSERNAEGIKKLNKRCDIIAEALNEIDFHYERENHAVDEVLSSLNKRLDELEEKMDRILSE